MLLPHLVSIKLIKPTLGNSSLEAFLLPTCLRSRFALRPHSEPMSCLHLFHPGLGCPFPTVPPLGAFLEHFGHSWALLAPVMMGTDCHICDRPPVSLRAGPAPGAGTRCTQASRLTVQHCWCLRQMLTGDSLASGVPEMTCSIVHMHIFLWWEEGP